MDFQIQIKDNGYTVRAFDCEGEVHEDLVFRFGEEEQMYKELAELVQNEKEYLESA